MCFATQDSTRKDSTQTFNIKSRDDELAHIRAREVQTHTAMENTSATTTAQQVIAEQNAAQVASSNVANAQAQPVAEGTEKQFSVQVTRVQLFEDSDIVNVQLTLNKTVPGFTKTKDGDYVAADVDRVSLSRSALTRALCEKNEMIATMRDGQATPLTRAQLSTILHGAHVALVRTYHVAGYTAEGREALTRDQWFTTIDDIKLSELAEKLIEQLVMQRMLSE